MRMGRGWESDLMGAPKAPYSDKAERGRSVFPQTMGTRN